MMSETIRQQYRCEMVRLTANEATRTVQIKCSISSHGGVVIIVHATANNWSHIFKRPTCNAHTEAKNKHT